MLVVVVVNDDDESANDILCYAVQSSIDNGNVDASWQWQWFIVREENYYRTT